ncbi:pimeloyl-ACP methyl ester carboxylesterase [Mumia flava]|uniref:Pimeloyl-ACP methyl ester carboxylesterase n=1 Tax=Mumia flava TaxID=1348852 RepID=A0A0B2BNL8_9ACTN|nr:alpha/beta fold hydrolase [Mumia flava]PJJ48315.1 pimeloyl-ACP methyl ester carboxylesterase [Mumia flava]
MTLRRTQDWDGRTIAWDVAGSGPPVVLCHGTPWSSYVWEEYGDALVAAGCTVYRWDMPGYGASSKNPDHRVGLDVQGEAFAAMLRSWGLERPHVIAHDIGGAVALRAHLLHGAPYASLCLVDVVALRPWGSPFFRLVREHAEAFAQLPDAIHRGAIEAYVAGASHRGLRPEVLDSLVAPWLGDEGRAAFYRQIAQADEEHTRVLEDRFAEIGMPVRVVWGTEDAWIPVDRAERLRDAIPDATVRLVPDAGHLVMLDAPVAVASQIRSWLSARGAILDE